MPEYYLCFVVGMRVRVVLEHFFHVRACVRVCAHDHSTEIHGVAAVCVCMYSAQKSQNFGGGVGGFEPPPAVKHSSGFTSFIRPIQRRNKRGKFLFFLRTPRKKQINTETHTQGQGDLLNGLPLSTERYRHDVPFIQTRSATSSRDVAV